MNWKKVAPWAVLSAGILLGLAGLALVALYLSQAVVGTLGTPDRSLLYWYLPFALLGIGATATGIGLVIWGSRELKKNP